MLQKQSKFQINFIKFLSVLVISALLCACDPASDCIIFDGPEFSNDPLPSGQVNQVYYSEISFFVNNNPHDSSYDYDLDFSGDLPSGLNYSIDYDRRKFILTGIPRTSGSYNFHLDIEVTEYYPNTSDLDDDIFEDGDDLCYATNSKDFTFIIN